MSWSRLAGVILMLAAVAGTIVAVGAGDRQRTAVDDRAAALDRSLESSEEALRTADDTVALVASVIDQLAGSLVAVEAAVLDSITTIDDAEDALVKLSEISGEDLPRIVESVEDALPALIQVADVIDGTLGALSFVGVPYDPEVPFDESLSGVADSIAGLTDQLAEQADLIAGVGTGLGGIADQAGELIIQMGVARVQLADGLALLNQYRATTASAIAAVGVERGLVSNRTDSEKTAIGWMIAAIVIAQVGLLVAGANLVFRRRDRVPPP
jgi:hypothetical protein